MSEYSYNFSHNDSQVNFLENLDLINFQIQKYDSPQPQENNNPTNYTDNQPQSSTNTRCFSIIDLSDESKKQYILTKRGSGAETMQLHPNFKTITRRHLRDLIYLKLINQKQFINCVEFMKNTPSFNSLRALLLPSNETQNLRERLIKFYSSSDVLKVIQRSSISLGQKLKMIKFIEKLRVHLFLNKQNKKWKGI